MPETAPPHLRAAAAEDMAEIARIYAHYVATSVYTFEETAPDVAEMAQRWRRIREIGLPWLVAQGNAGAILGYAYAGPFRARSAYRYTLENSVYVAPDAQRRGAGRALMDEVIRQCAALGYRQMIAVIGDTANTASIALHARLGFRHIGHETAVGLKFGRWIDVVQMQLALGAGEGSIPVREPGA